ncbi:hypothetical protein Kpol_1010p44 [Vanderwaltozyma polyspora DSM 70294]|uniref:Thioredoxin domain-containing protein n=1 Tax=Vanderwaltozyma polyspora (strain ATCC 22028 / DSM 70294 / BCRC 21397 / CBS 2163 / NBRC 10782 / NRRL Y-8283 / UCD 57-17) TaxID=436907 RepID=A7TIJ0_VANPO|nr:uncharacterized protein Kpol_1010p44 [Vanderwaltozyma polyspora DSM 70294]EDO17928.1 hypothetical protein Kpol_1010p44 [Vanderwaltozyma polyspora DSM 70294]
MLYLAHSLEQLNDLINTKGELVVVEYYRTYCTSCQIMDSVILQYAREFEANLKLVKVDIDKVHVPNADSITVTPTFDFYKDGINFSQFVGSDPVGLKKVIASHV